MPYNNFSSNEPVMRYEVLVPSAMYESGSVLDLDSAYDLMYDLAEEHGYAEIRHNGHPVSYTHLRAHET